MHAHVRNNCWYFYRASLKPDVVFSHLVQWSSHVGSFNGSRIRRVRRDALRETAGGRRSSKREQRCANDLARIWRDLGRNTSEPIRGNTKKGGFHATDEGLGAQFPRVARVVRGDGAREHSLCFTRVGLVSSLGRSRHGAMFRERQHRENARRCATAVGRLARTNLGTAKGMRVERCATGNGGERTRDPFGIAGEKRDATPGVILDTEGIKGMARTSHQSRLRELLPRKIR